MGVRLRRSFQFTEALGRYFANPGRCGREVRQMCKRIERGRDDVVSNAKNIKEIPINFV
jgi:hypothetical protein